jgi:hypothetical protein
MMNGVLSEILTQICPATANTHHHSLSILTNRPDKKLDRCGPPTAVEMVEPYR